MNTKQTEALKLALEALESCEMSNYGRDWVWPATAHETAMKNVKEAITALREALAEQPAQQQEPVAWIYEDELPECYPYDDMYGLSRIIEGVRMFPVNVAPPASKPWVGLTQQDINIAFDDTQEGGGFDDFARAIETKLREKNAPQQSKEDA